MVMFYSSQVDFHHVYSINSSPNRVKLSPYSYVRFLGALWGSPCSESEKQNTWYSGGTPSGTVHQRETVAWRRSNVNGFGFISQPMCGWKNYCCCCCRCIPCYGSGAAAAAARSEGLLTLPSTTTMEREIIQQRVQIVCIIALLLLYYSPNFMSAPCGRLSCPLHVNCVHQH